MLTSYFRISKYTGSPKTTFVMCRNDPVRDMSKPPNDAYAVLYRSDLSAHREQWVNAILILTQFRLRLHQIYIPTSFGKRQIDRSSVESGLK